MSQFTLDAAIPIALIGQEAEFFQFLETNRNLLFGYLSQCPIGERKVMKQAYIDSKHEKEWNEIHAKRLQEVQDQFEMTVGAELAKTNPKLYKDRKYRIVLEEEVRCVQRELQQEYEGNTDWGVVKLKEDTSTFSERWPQVLFNRYKVPEEEFEEKRKEIAKLDDFVLLWENVCLGAGAGNTFLGNFAMEVGKCVGKVANEILKTANIPSDNPGELSRYRLHLEKIPPNRRNIVLMHYFTDLLSYLLGCRNGSLCKTVPLLSDQEVPEVNKVAVETAALYASSFPLFEKRYIDLIENCKNPDEKSAKEYPEYVVTTLNNSLISQSYYECNLVKNALADFLTLLQISLDIDFTKEEITRARSVGVGQLTKKMEQMNFNVLKMSRSPAAHRPRTVSRTGRAQTVGSIEDAMSTLTISTNAQDAVVGANTVPRSKSEQSRRDAKIKNSKSADYRPEIDRTEEYRRIQGYVKVFTHTFNVFQKIIVMGEKLRLKEKKK
jgi:hypothetical protein